MYTVTYRFEEIKQTKSGVIHCPQCGKKRKLTISRSYCRNGMHNESDTRQKNEESLEKELAELQEKGCICQACEDENNNEPITEKVTDMNELGLPEFRVIDRKTKQVIGSIVKEKWGSYKWRCLGLRWVGSSHDRCYQNKYEAARAFRSEFMKEAKP